MLFRRSLTRYSSVFSKVKTAAAAAACAFLTQEVGRGRQCVHVVVVAVAVVARDERGWQNPFSLCMHVSACMPGRQELEVQEKERRRRGEKLHVPETHESENYYSLALDCRPRALSLLLCR